MPQDDPDTVMIQRVPIERIIDVRHAMLRRGLPREEAVFPGDDAPSSMHLAAIAGGEVVGCLTLHLNRWQTEPAWQLRGMACRDDWQKQGIGRRLVEFAEQRLLEGRGPSVLWCNARVAAVGFYRKMGWEVVSEEFDIPTAGPHVKMIKRLSAIDQANLQ